jgi:hypothetical protein
MLHLHTENKGKNMGLEKFNFVGWGLEIPNTNIYRKSGCLYTVGRIYTNQIGLFNRNFKLKIQLKFLRYIFR